MKKHVAVTTRDIKSIQYLIGCAGLPFVTTRASHQTDEAFEFEFELASGDGKFVVSHFPSDKRGKISLVVQSSVSLEPNFGAKINDLGSVMRNIQWCDPSQLPKWDQDRAIEADIFSLRHLEIALNQDKVPATYQVISSREPWLTSQFTEDSELSTLGDFCQVPSFTRSFLLLIAANDKSEEYVMKLVVFL